MSTSLLRAENISLRTRQAKLLLDDASFSLQIGQVHALLGPNGAGKSTLLKVLSGDIKVDKGAISLAGKPLHEFSQLELAQQRGVLPQLNAMGFELTVAEVVAMGRYPHRDQSASCSQRIVQGALQQLEVDHLQQRSYPSLSGGEQQRVQLARVLAQETDILLLDEPLSALDIAHQLQVMELLKALAAQGKAVIIVLHDINLALRYASHVSLLKNGKIIAQGETESVITQQQLLDVFSVASSIEYNHSMQARQVSILKSV